MSHTPGIRVLLIGALTMIIFSGLVMSHGVWSTITEANLIGSTTLRAGEASVFTDNEYGFTLNTAGISALLADFTCDENAPKKPDARESTAGQYTYCQNSGDPVKVALAWKDLELKKELFLERTANTVASYTGKDGEYRCREDKSYTPRTRIGGVVSDCVITMQDGSLYFVSAFFFYPDNESGMSHVLYAYSLNGSGDQTEVMQAVRSIASGLSVETEKTARNNFRLIPVAYAQDGGGDGGGSDGGGGGDSGGDGGDSGGGDGGGDAGGGCGCDGGGDTGGSTGGSGGDAPGDTGGGYGDWSGDGDGTGGSGGGSTGGGDGGGGVPPQDPDGEDPVSWDANLPPRVNAGPDIRIRHPQMYVRINGASASDPEGGPMTLRWIRASSPTYDVLIGGGTSLTPTMSRLILPGTYVFTLVARDNKGLTSADSMRVIVEPEGTTDNPDDPTGDDDGTDGDGGGGDGTGGGGGGGTSGGGGGDGGDGTDDDDDGSDGTGSGDGPQVWSNKLLVQTGGEATISWDTNNGDESLCRLTGGTLGSSHSPIPHLNGGMETGSRVTDINGRTTFILDCEEDGRDSVTVDVIPDIKES
jgi:hypothetical protein